MSDKQAVIDVLLANVRDAVAVAGADHRLLLIGNALESLTGFSAQEILDGAGAAADVRSRLCEALTCNDGGRWHGNLIDSAGKPVAVDVSVSAVNGVEDFPSHYLAFVRPATEEKGRFGHDDLTGLPNREIFDDRVERAILQVNRLGGSVALLMMGLDRFTLINDALGHGAGDRLLIEVARRLRHCIRETDTAVRLGGDKFALVMTIANVNDCVIVAEKVLRAMQDPFLIDGQEAVVTFSIGISAYPQDCNSASQLIMQSDNALHYAKVSGRNQYQFFSKEMNAKARSRLDLEARMRRALAQQEFVVFYQPKVQAESGRIVGAEALVRWQDPDRGMISPGEFIPVAEETGLIEEIGAWVLRRSCEENSAWHAKGLGPVKVSVNVSARQFRSRRLLETVTGILGDTKLDPRWLELEITESMLMNDVEAAVHKMEALRNIGLGLSIDDFGTGYSSLSYLGRFPITTLKIDRAFITDVDTNHKTAEIARAIIGLSHGLKLEVVAEGAEVAEHVAFLKANGCDTVQGFFYSRPVPSDQFERMLREGIPVRQPG